MKKLILLIAPLLLSSCTFSVSKKPDSSSNIDSTVSQIISQNESSSEKVSSSEKESSKESSQVKSSKEELSSSIVVSSKEVPVSSSEKPSSSKESSSEKISSAQPSSEKSSSFESSSEKPSSSKESSSEKPSSSSGGDYGTGWYNGYYNNVLSWKNSNDLITKLHAIIRNGYNPLYYNSNSKTNWESNQYADQSLDDFETVDAVYTNYSIRKDNTGNTGLNREHAFCASLMTGMSTSDAVKYLGRATDYHNLFAAEYEGNTSRSNKCFGVAGADGTKVTTVKDSEKNIKYSYSTKCFEPSDYDKGRLSRAIFYMAVMYNFEETYYNSDKSKSSTWPAVSIVEGNVDYDSKNPTYSIGYRSTLLNWATSYEVDRLEYQHNESVYSHIYSGQQLAQNNRNPFVDYPELIEYAFGSKTNEAGELRYLKPSAYTLNINSKEFSNYAIKEAPRVYSNFDTFKYSDLSFVEVKNNYSFTNTSKSFACSIENGTKMNVLGDKKVTITIDGQKIDYNVHVVNGALDQCNYVGSFAGAEKSLKINSANITLSDVKWNLTYTNKVTTFNANNILYDNGVQIGTSTVNAGTLTLESDVSFNGVDKVYCKVNTASKKTYSVSIYVNDQMVLKPTSFSYNVSEYNVIGLELTTPVSGKVKYVFSNVTAAFYISCIAVNSIS